MKRPREGLSRVELHHEVLGADDRNFLTRRNVLESRGVVGQVDGHVRSDQTAGFGLVENRALLASLTNRDHVAGLEPLRWDRRLLALEPEVTVGHVLAGGIDRRSETGPQYQGIHPDLEQLHEIVASRSRHPGSHLVGLAELAFADVV